MSDSGQVQYQMNSGFFEEMNATLENNLALLNQLYAKSVAELQAASDSKRSVQFSTDESPFSPESSSSRRLDSDSPIRYYNIGSGNEAQEEDDGEEHLPMSIETDDLVENDDNNLFSPKSLKAIHAQRGRRGGRMGEEELLRCLTGVLPTDILPDQEVEQTETNLTNTESVTPHTKRIIEMAQRGRRGGRLGEMEMNRQLTGRKPDEAMARNFSPALMSTDMYENDATPQRKFNNYHMSIDLDRELEEKYGVSIAENGEVMVKHDELDIEDIPEDEFEEEEQPRRATTESLSLDGKFAIRARERPTPKTYQEQLESRHKTFEEDLYSQLASEMSINMSSF